mmetsp:Transcript_7143/g.15394  ORF Transcript_7143/g.15394 Transcript_7143/m.15394 type:complete len:312 (+) Transcript_7143:85-1020(+)
MQIPKMTAIIRMGALLPLIISGLNLGSISAFAPGDVTAPKKLSARNNNFDLSAGYFRNPLQKLKRSVVILSGIGDDEDVDDFFDYKSQKNDDGDFAPKSQSSSGDFFSSNENNLGMSEPPLPEPYESDEPMTLEELEMLATPFDEYVPKLNSVTLVGRTGNNPEPRYFDDGKVVLNLPLAVRRKYHPLERKVRNLSYQDDETDWFPLEFWGRDAEYVTKYVEKGTRIGVTGVLAMDGWVDKMSGEPRRKAKIVVRHIDILETRAESELRRGGGGGWNRGGASGSGSRKYDDDEDDDGRSPAFDGSGGFFSS